MNTPTPAQALGDVIARLDKPQELNTIWDGLAAIDILRQYGAKFASLSEENDQLHAELDFLTAQHERCTAYMVNHRGRLVYANSAMRDAYSDEHVRAEAAEARCAELETELNSALHEISCCDDVNLGVPLAQSIGELQQHRERLEARVREAEGLLREAEPYIGQIGKPSGLFGRIAAFLAARG